MERRQTAVHQEAGHPTQQYGTNHERRQEQCQRHVGAGAPGEEQCDPDLKSPVGGSNIGETARVRRYSSRRCQCGRRHEIEHAKEPNDCRDDPNERSFHHALP
ncbi:uncharacterized protein METZ01_LOCUS70566 [marine metagenome]|uniref:Uncharacterized protein n=1 Tax=marine metagenome TaxID=408172 RepID=A0A381TNQ4_9ZZZZ